MRIIYAAYRAQNQTNQENASGFAHWPSGGDKMKLSFNVYGENENEPLGDMRAFSAEVKADGWIDVSINDGPRLWFEPLTQFIVE